MDEQADALGLGDLDQGLEENLNGIAPSLDLDLDEGLGAIFEAGSAALGGILRKGLRSGLVLLTVVMLCSLAEGMYDGVRGGMPDVVSIVGALAVTAASVSDIQSLIGLGREALVQMETFSKALLPTMAAATALGGSPGAGVARQLATLLFSDVLLTAINRLLLPLVYAYIGASTAYAAVGNEGLKRVGGAVKWLVTSMLTGILLLFVGYLTVSGVIAGTADAAAIKAAKVTISGMIPVVGGILSDAAETVLAGAGILRNVVGLFGMLAVLGICVIPFLQLGVHYLVYRVAAALSATVSSGRVAGLIDAIGGAFGLILGMTGACALMLLISMMVSILMIAV